MDKEFKFWLSTFIAYILIILYAAAVIIMIFNHELVSPETSDEQIVSGIETITTLVSGLISALIISILAVSEKNPVEKLTGRKSKIERKVFLIYLYACTWMIVGVTALIMGTVLGKVQPVFITTVSDLGTAWLATAVASG